MSLDFSADRGKTIARCLWLLMPSSTRSSSLLSDRNAVQSWSTRPPRDRVSAIFFTSSILILPVVLNLLSLCLMARALLPAIFLSEQVMKARLRFLSYSGQDLTRTLQMILCFKYKLGIGKLPYKLDVGPHNTFRYSHCHMEAG